MVAPDAAESKGIDNRNGALANRRPGLGLQISQFPTAAFGPLRLYGAWGAWPFTTVAWGVSVAASFWYANTATVV